MSVTKTKINKVQNVNFVVKHPEFVSYEFVTTEEVFIEEAEMETTLFRLFVQDNGTLEVMVANDEDYDVHEEVSDLFDLEAIKAVCEAADPLSDLTKEYIAFYELQGEEL
jgi:hypothetical protein